MSSKLLSGTDERSITNSNKTRDATDTRKPEPSDPISGVLPAVEDAIRSIEFGTVNVIVQNGVVVQIEKTEKIRLR